MSRGLKSFGMYRGRVVIAATLLLVCGLMAGSVQAEGIRWLTPPGMQASGAVPAGEAADVAAELESLAVRPAAKRVVLQFDAPLRDDQRDALESAGVTLLSYLGDHAYFATLHEERLNARFATTVAPIHEAKPIDPIVKLTPVLARGETPTWAVVNADMGEEPVIGTYIMFHRDVDLEYEAIPLVEMYGGTVRDALESINALVVEMPQSLVPNLATEDAVQWIEEALPLFAEMNDSNRTISQANTVQNIPYDLDGTGVTVLVYDGGTARATHNDFGGRLTVHDSSGVADHATHVCGTVGGDGTSSGGTYRGMAPNCTILSYGFEYDGTGTFLYTNPGDIESDYTQAIALGADVSNNSIGTNTEPNGFPCEYQGNYGTTSNLIDAIVRGAVSGGVPFRICWANGNERQGSRCDVEGYGDYYSTAPPAGAKNHIAVGAVNSNDGSMTTFSSWGPLDDGRMKPDISAPGCQSNGDTGVTSTSYSSDSAYTVKCGTSMASPTVAGLTALLLQDYRDQYSGMSDPRNSTIKAFYAQTAMEAGNGGPDYQFGYGIVQIQDAIDFMREGNFEENEITQGEAIEYLINVPTGAAEMKATLAWDDFPATPNVNPTLVNDLDLEVYDPSNNRHYPWTLNPTNPSAVAVRTAPNRLDNIEQVKVDNPVAGQWRIVINGYNVPEGPQSYSICASSQMIPVGFRVRFPEGLPSQLLPGVSDGFTVSIASETESIVPGTAMVNFRYNGGDWLESPLTALGGNLYQATLPPATCDATPEFYVSFVGTVSGLITRPSADAPFTAIVGEDVIVFADDFETDMGWSVQNSGLTDGPWERGIPVTNCNRGNPTSDYDGSGYCYLTDNAAQADCNTDVDGGYTWLISPTLDLSAGDNEIRFALWYTNNFGADPDNDLFKIYVSNDNGSNWTLVETVGPTTPSSSWVQHSFRVGDFVTPNATVKVRFEASDLNSGSVVEAGIDAFYIGGFECNGTFADCNANAIPDSDDIASGRSADVNGNSVPDECESVGCLGDVNSDGVINISDLAQLLGNYGMTSGASFEQGDLDDDGDVDISDLAALLGVYGQSCP